MDLFANLAFGFSVAVTPTNIMLCLIGALVGTLVGVLPGIGTIATVAMLLPITFGLPPVGALIMLAGIYYGAQYGGSTTSILVNIPGEATSVVTTLDGHQMAKQGRAGPALAIAAIGSFFAGCVATVLIAVLGAPLTKLALAFGPAEYFSLMVLGLIFAVVLAKGSVLKAIAMIAFGILLSMVGSDIETGASRMAFNIPELADGLGFATVAMGVFGFAEIIRNLDSGAEMDRDLVQQKITGLMPTKKDMIDSGGVKIYPKDIEEVAVQHEAVQEVAVFGIPSDEWGESVHAVVVPRPAHTVTADELIAFGRAHLAGYKVPRSIAFADELPKTGSGKLLKRSLREPFWRGRKTRV